MRAYMHPNMQASGIQTYNRQTCSHTDNQTCTYINTWYTNTCNHACLAKLYVKPTQGILCGLCADIHAAKMSRGHAAKMSSRKMSALCVYIYIYILYTYVYIQSISSSLSLYRYTVYTWIYVCTLSSPLKHSECLRVSVSSGRMFQFEHATRRNTNKLRTCSGITQRTCSVRMLRNHGVRMLRKHSGIQQRQHCEHVAWTRYGNVAHTLIGVDLARESDMEAYGADPEA